jgi:hypothetical protein
MRLTAVSSSFIKGAAVCGKSEKSLLCVNYVAIKAEKIKTIYAQWKHSTQYRMHRFLCLNSKTRTSSDGASRTTKKTDAEVETDLQIAPWFK